MFFTQDDLKKIESWILRSSKKDTSFDNASLPLTGEEIVAIVQDGINTKIEVKELISNLSGYIKFEGSIFKGVAYPSTVPEIDTHHSCFYFATDKGVYTNFSNIELDGTKLAIISNYEDDLNNWKVDLLNVRLDAVNIANSAVDTAEEALEIAESFKEDFKRVEYSANKATETANSSFSIASEAILLAEDAIPKSERGKPMGVPILDGEGKIPLSFIPIQETELVDSYQSNRVDAAPTAAALYRLYDFHEADIVKTKDILNAVLNLVKDTTEIGIAPTEIEITSEAQNVVVQIICNGEWNITKIPENLVTASSKTGNGNSSVTLSFKANSSETDNVVGTIEISNSFGKKKVITFTQLPASLKYVYTLTAEPSEVNVNALQGNGVLTIVSTKQAFINNSPKGDPENVPYTMEVSPEASKWLSVNSSSRQYSYLENILEATRTGNIIIKQNEDGGNTTKVAVTQAAATISTEYEFTITPANANIADIGSGGTYPAKIKSVRKTIVNNTESTSDVEYLTEFSGDVNSEWVTINKEAGTITLPLNTGGSARSGAITFKQMYSNKVITVNISQEPAVVDWVYTFEYTPTSMSFTNAAGSKTYNVTKSVKQKTINGKPVGEEIYVDYTVEISGTGFTLDAAQSKVSVSQNNTEQSRTGTITFKRAELGDSGNKTISLSQAAGTVTWQYNLSAAVNPSTVEALNGKTTLNVTSTKQKLVNGSASGNPVNVAWTAKSKNGWMTGANTSGSSWTMTENTSTSTRKEVITVTQSEGGKSTTVEVTQKAATVTYDYVFSVSPTSMAFEAKGSSKSVSITSTKQKKINGKNSGSPTTVSYTSAASGTGFSVSGTTIKAVENRTLSSRTGSVKFTQNESGKAVTVSLSQKAGVESYVYTFSVSPTSLSFSNYGETRSVTVTSTKQRQINGTNEGSPTSVGYTNTNTNTAVFTVSSTSITAKVNTTLSARNATLTFTQNESGKTAKVTLTQKAGTQYSSYELSALSIVEITYNVTASKEVKLKIEEVTEISGVEQSRTPISSSDWAATAITLKNRPDQLRDDADHFNGIINENKAWVAPKNTNNTKFQITCGAVITCNVKGSVETFESHIIHDFRRP